MEIESASYIMMKEYQSLIKCWKNACQQEGKQIIKIFSDIFKKNFFQ